MTEKRAKSGEFGRFGLVEIRQVSALGRSVLPRTASPDGDAEAQKRICAGMEPFGGPVSEVMFNQMRPMSTFRCEFFDGEILAALDAGITQVVNCGAGFDDRALRFRSPGTAYYELDLPAVVAEKARRLNDIDADRTGCTIAEADFELDDVAQVLRDLGHRESEPSLFLCEHLFVFLTEGAVSRLLKGLADAAAGGSRLATSIEVCHDQLDPVEVLDRRNDFFGGPRPMNTILWRSAWLDHFARAGWRVDHPDRINAIDHTDDIQTQTVAAVV